MLQNNMFFTLCFNTVFLNSFVPLYLANKYPHSLPHPFLPSLGYLPTDLSIYLSTYLSIYLPIYLPI